MQSPPLDVLYEDNHLLAVNKPAGLPTMGVAADRPSLLEQAKRYVKTRYGKPGNVYLGVVSRLDAPVTGVTLLARTSKAARRLSEQFRTRQVEKTYWAVVAGHVTPAAGECVDWVLKDERHRKMHVVSAERHGAREARLRYSAMRGVPGGTLLEIELLTGRKHQIRLQLAARGWPILGDRKYGGPTSFGPGVALHARQLRFEHPTLRTAVTIKAPLPPSWDRFRI